MPPCAIVPGVALTLELCAGVVRGSSACIQGTGGCHQGRAPAPVRDGTQSAVPACHDGLAQAAAGAGGACAPPGA